MISFDEAIELVRSVAQPLGSERVAIADAAGRVLAEPIVARIDSPRTDVSAMDGYAVRDADLAPLPARLKVISSSFAGHASVGGVEPGTAVRTFTGAPIPAGADRIVIQENVERDGEWALINEQPGSSRHVRKRGADFSVGEELVSPGRLLDPRGVVAAAAADIAEIVAYRRPKLHVLSTGDELAEPGHAHERANAIPESVSFGVAALARQWGGEVQARTRLRDDLEVMRNAALAAVDQCDLVIVTGGASVGEKDFAKPMFEPAGLELAFSKVSIKPGKPVWMGRAGDALVLGLPGNPTSALVTARLFLAPLLAGLTGLGVESALKWRQAVLGDSIAACGARETFHRARLVDGAAQLLSFQDSSAQKVLVDADVLVRQRANTSDVETDSIVDVLDF